MTAYKLFNGGLLRDDGVYIPNDSRNSDYRAFISWLSQGNSPQPEFTLAELRANAVLRIKAEAQSLILPIMSEVKQRNNLARSLELVYKVVLGGTLTVPEQSELQAILSQWAQIKTIRENSNAAEQLIITSNNPDSITLL